jgi:PleD family two-component response regulator
MIEKCDKTLFKANEQNFKISFAFGITSFKQGDLLSEIIDTADKEMYTHKRSRDLS